MKLLTVTILILALLTGCQAALQAESPAPASNDERVWVAARIAGGKQCEPPPYTPPDTKRVLEEAGITVFETAIEHLSVCMACDICPAYAAKHYALIKMEQLTEAAKLGFKQSDTPPMP